MVTQCDFIHDCGDAVTENFEFFLNEKKCLVNAKAGGWGWMVESAKASAVMIEMRPGEFRRRAFRKRIRAECTLWFGDMNEHDVPINEPIFHFLFPVKLRCCRLHRRKKVFLARIFILYTKFRSTRRRRNHNFNYAGEAEGGREGNQSILLAGSESKSSSSSLVPLQQCSRELFWPMQSIFELSGNRIKRRRRPRCSILFGFQLWCHFPICLAQLLVYWRCDCGRRNTEKHNYCRHYCWQCNKSTI